MKIRIAHGTLAVRLSIEDLQELERTGTLVQMLRFGQGREAQLRWVLEVVEEGVSGPQPAAHMEGTQVRISIGPDQLVRLSEDERASEEAQIGFDDGHSTRIIVERDLKPRRHN